MGQWALKKERSFSKMQAYCSITSIHLHVLAAVLSSWKWRRRLLFILEFSFLLKLLHPSQIRFSLSSASRSAGDSVGMILTPEESRSIRRGRNKQRLKTKAGRRKALQMVWDHNKTAVQILYDRCKTTFTSDVESTQAVESVMSVVDRIKACDVGLDEGVAQDRERNALSSLPIYYQHMYECKFFTIGIFCLPTSAVMPLHDHPGMTVISKLLYGSIKIKAYDWADPLEDDLHLDESQPRLARVVRDQVLTAPCEPWVLYASSSGNMHSFQALSPCALLDVLAPPYSDERQCSYFREFEFENSQSLTNFGVDMEEGGRYVWLQKCGEDFAMQSMQPEPYRGPKPTTY